MLVEVVVTFCVVISQVLTERCTTPNNEEAECISYYSCQVLVDEVAARQNAAREFIRQSICGNNASNPMVCCGSTATFSLANRNAVEGLFPSRKFCGYQHADDFARSGLLTISIHEFPWLALLLFEDSEKVVRGMCSGSLISHRYVLTAAHCVSHNKYKLIAVRLGEYNVKNKTDCTDDGTFYECSDPIEEYGVERKISHPGFNWTTFSDNIALVRLNRGVTYSDFIRPICLPFPGTKFAEPGDTVIISGWAKTAVDNRREVIKKKITRTVISFDECSLSFTRPLRDNQFCTKRIDPDSESCQGDSGGPIMFSYRLQWHQEGIYTPGVNCSRHTRAHVKIAKYLDWIESNVEV